MEYRSYTLNGVKIHIVKDDISNLRLLQAKARYPLSSFFLDGKKPAAIINCSYFTTEYAIGRNQGDLTQSTSSFTDKGWLGFALKDDLTYKAGKLDWWDVETSKCGFTPSTINILDGKDVQLYTTEFNASFDADMKQTRCETIFAILSNKKNCLLVTAENGLTGYQVINYLKTLFTFDFLCCLDNGGSTEMIVDGVIKQRSLDGSERKMFNGLAFIKPEEKPIDIDLMFPCKEGWGSQEFHEKDHRAAHYGIDIGWIGTESKDGKTDILDAADGEVAFEGYYTQVINGATYKPIGVILKHNFSDIYDYYSLYWHLSSDCVKVGQKVLQGQKIGTKGNTGYSNGVHLHFQTFRVPKGSPLPNYTEWGKYSFDPIPYITVYDDIQLYPDNKSVFKLKHATTKAEEPVEDDQNELNELKNTIKELNKTIITLKDLNNTLDISLKEKNNLIINLENKNNILNNKLNEIKNILKEGTNE